jgi:hypothetical protein
MFMYSRVINFRQYSDLRDSLCEHHDTGSHFQTVFLISYLKNGAVMRTFAVLEILALFGDIFYKICKVLRMDPRRITQQVLQHKPTARRHIARHTALGR